MRGSSLILFQSAMGAGALSLAGAAKNVGMVGESAMLVLGAFQVWWLLFQLGKMAIRTKSAS